MPTLTAEDQLVRALQFTSGAIILLGWAIGIAVFAF